MLIETCDSEDVRILKGVVSKNHVHMHIEYPPSKSISDLVKRLKGRSSRLLQHEFPELKKRYWGKHLWGIGYGAWSAGNTMNILTINKERSNEYSENFQLG